MAKLNDAARKQTVRIENSGGNGSGVIVAREGNSYYVVTAKQSFENGYDIIYSSISYGGMSGGAVFDTAGRVIGIHGQAERINGTILGNSLGISMQTLIGLAEKLQLNPKLLRIAKTPALTLTVLDLKTIETAMQNLTKPNPEDNGERWLTYGNQLDRTRQLDESVRAFDTAISKGQILTGNYAKALSLAGLGKYDLAQAAIAKAIEAVPPKNRADYYYFWNYQSLIFSSQEKYALALQSIDVAIKLEPQDRKLLNEKAQILSSQKQYASAIRIYDSMIRDREEAYSYLNRGNAKSALGDKQGAISDYDRAIKINSNYAEAYCNRGIVKSELGDKQGAISDYDRAIKLNSNYAEAYSNRGGAKFALGDKQGAISDFDRAIKLNYNYAEAYYNRGLAKSELGNKQGAIADYDRAIRINPNLAIAYSNRGIVKSALGDKQGAIADYDRAIKINPNYADAYYNRGVVKSELGDKQGAISDLSKAAELFRQQGQMDVYKAENQKIINESTKSPILEFVNRSSAPATTLISRCFERSRGETTSD